MTQMNYLAIIQARMSSTRLPGKVMMEINGIPEIKFQIDRIRQSKVESIVVATSVDPSDDVLAAYLDSLGVEVRRGPLNDVAGRYKQILDEINPTNFLRFTADCPFSMPSLINEMIDRFSSEQLDYLSNANPPTFPDGLDVEIVKTSAFSRLVSENLTILEREHVTLGFVSRESEFAIANHENDEDLSQLRWTLDYQGDLEYIRKISQVLSGQEITFTIVDVMKVIEENPEIKNRISGDKRNIGLKSASKISGVENE